MLLKNIYEIQNSSFWLSYTADLPMVLVNYRYFIEHLEQILTLNLMIFRHNQTHSAQPITLSYYRKQLLKIQFKRLHFNLCFTCDKDVMST